MKAQLQNFSVIQSINFEKKEDKDLIFPIKKELYLEVHRDGTLMLELCIRDKDDEREYLSNTQFHFKFEDLIDTLKILGLVDLKFES